MSPSRNTGTQTLPVRWEVGSEFHWMGVPAEPCLPWPKQAAWFALGRHAIAELAAELKAQTIWVPEYFCHDVAECWRAAVPVRVYRDEPRRPEPEFKSIEAGPRDIVVAVNYFGTREGKPWQAWRRKHDCVLVEDHSHDPFSPWALKSRADFAFASLRKTLPVPDGALLWSPAHLPLRAPSDGHDWTGSAMKLAAMMWKTEYLSGKGTSELKTTFRELQKSGEERLERSAPSSVSPWSEKYLAAGVPTKWRNQRRENTRRLLENLSNWNIAKPLFSDWPSEAVPFAAVLVFRSQSARDEYRSYLSSQNVFCPIHWESPGGATEEVRELASRVLSIPTDQRYSADDMDRVASLLRSK